MWVQGHLPEGYPLDRALGHVKQRHAYCVQSFSACLGLPWTPPSASTACSTCKSVLVEDAPIPTTSLRHEAWAVECQSRVPSHLQSGFFALF